MLESATNVGQANRSRQGLKALATTFQPLPAEVDLPGRYR